MARGGDAQVDKVSLRIAVQSHPLPLAPPPAALSPQPGAQPSTGQGEEGPGLCFWETGKKPCFLFYIKKQSDV